MIDIRIETFIAVCDYMNFTHAAEALNLTQPAVSRQMKSLEEYYDVQLFRYEGKKMYVWIEAVLGYVTACMKKCEELDLNWE